MGSNLFLNIARNRSFRTDFLPEGQYSTLEQSGNFTNLGGGGYGQLGLDYDLTPKDALNLSVRGNLFGYTNARSQFTRYAAPTSLDENNRDIDTHNQNNNLDLNFGYVKTLGGPGRS
ncbi:hypothetical protein [Hymenobacter cellulosilyticus]|uniref:TonB-dependent receptor n=1 Tax=Hymenobacter cellulosilyticus TaxID=2932248 RepID=A0A8T9Q6W0_9BACT|nr:hypothetical protein [Hymenobacter cellulosilyticus]UOQ71758.1 hypothetical protein MUN79_24665 [Hymenobacter cellulosilyticus]